MLLDIDAAYERGCQALTDVRGDEALPHLGGDVAGLCDRLAHERRRRAVAGEAPFEYDTTTLSLFWIGHEVEHGVLDRVDAGLPNGFYMDRNVRVEIDGVVGHADAVVRQIIDEEADEDPAVLVIDTKSTVWWPQYDDFGQMFWKPKEVKDSHCLQVSAYAIALGCPSAAIYEFDLGGKDRRFVSVDPEQYRNQVMLRVAEVLERTDPSKPAPVAEPNRWAKGWACGSVQEKTSKKTGQTATIVRKSYCPHTGCPMNVANREVAF